MGVFLSFLTGHKERNQTPCYPKRALCQFAGRSFLQRKRRGRCQGTYHDRSNRS